MRRRHGQNQGFTLIELSIVLVIIGLIVGGVLVGQDLIKAAETRATLAQIEKYNTAVNTFKTKYNGIPGDLIYTDAASFGFSAGSNGQCGGQAQGMRDGNGLIDGFPAPAQYYQGFDEPELFWADLSVAGFLDTQIPNGNAPPIECADLTNATTLSSTMIGEYLPLAKLGRGNYVYVYEYGGINWFGIGAVTGFGNAWAVATTLPVIQAYNIDKKIDDGLPQSGSVQTNYVFNRSMVSNPPNGNPDTASTCYNNSTNTYSTNISGGSNPNCALSFKMQGAAR